MLDGEETVEIACGELRWEGARQHAGRTGNRANILQRASLGGSETAHAGRIGNHANSLRRASLERERCSMLGGQETVEIACGELYRRGESKLDGDETVEIACGELRWEKRDSMLDG